MTQATNSFLLWDCPRRTRFDGDLHFLVETVVGEKSRLHSLTGIGKSSMSVIVVTTIESHRAYTLRFVD